MTIDWSKAPEWAGCVIRSDEDELGTLYWAEPWGTRDGKRRIIGSEGLGSSSVDLANTSGQKHSWILVDFRPVNTSDLINNDWPESPTLHCQRVGRAARIPQWSGDGLPPIGTVCEFQPWEDQSSPWTGLTILAHWLAPNGTTYSWGHRDYGWVAPQSMRFRPTRTPKQIAAEARSKACDAMYGIMTSPPVRDGNRSDMAEALYDAGYRKFEITGEES